jgi:hypothetical protein
MHRHDADVSDMASGVGNAFATRDQAGLDCKSVSRPDRTEVDSLQVLLLPESRAAPVVLAAAAMHL